MKNTNELYRELNERLETYKRDIKRFEKEKFHEMYLISLARFNELTTTIELLNSYISNE